MTDLREQIEAIVTECIKEALRKRELDHAESIDATDAILALVQPQWKPIEDAPKDGTEIVGLDTTTGTRHVTNWDCAGREWSDPDRHYYSETPPFNPTHFMPLSSRPQVKS